MAPGLSMVPAHNAQTGLIKRNLKTGDESWLAYPVQRDEQESIAPLGVYPAMTFTPDSKHLLAFYGGKIHQISIDDNTAKEIPFEVDEEIAYGPRVYFDYKVSDDPEMTVTQIRDPQLSPDGKRIAFTALNRLYVSELERGEPFRVTKNDFTEAMPTWSPDGTELAFVSWEEDGGNIYRVEAKEKAKPELLTEEKGYYVNPVWDANTDRIIFTEGPAHNYVSAIDPFSFGTTQKLSWIPATGGKSTEIGHTHGRSNPHFVNGEERIYLNHPEKGLVSIRWDDTDEKQHLKITGITTYPANFSTAHSCMLVESETEPKKKAVQGFDDHGFS